MPTNIPDDWIPILVGLATALGVVVAALVGGMATLIVALVKNRADKKIAEAQLVAQKAVTKAQIDARIDERVDEQLESAYARIDALEKEQQAHTLQMSAVARILRAIARQWQGEHGPDLDPGDIALIEETIPAHWIRARREST